MNWTNLSTSLLVFVFLAERVWKQLAIMRFFRRRLPVAGAVRLVSVLQPILSGDPTLEACLEANLLARGPYPREFLWLVDTDDAEGQRICQALISRHPAATVRLLLLPPPGERQNPKMFKLIQGAAASRGDILVVLDDDTVLPDDGLAECVPFLFEPGAGLAFGLPYYTSFGTFWSRLVAYFVNSHSLLTYIPYTTLAEPATINGMFYALRRATFDAISGFDGLEHTLADDFAVAQRVRSHGLRLVQTPLRHGISTSVAGPRRYLNLIQRWFIFPRESLMRHLRGRDLLLLYGLVLVPAFAPWLLASLALWQPIIGLGGLALYLGLSYVMFMLNNIRYLRRASPWQWSWMVPLIQVTFPAQLLVALLSPQRITWRGHQMEVERGGGFRFVRRRGE